MPEGHRVVKRRRPAGNRGAKRVASLLRSALEHLPAELREDIEAPASLWEDIPEPASLMPPPEPPRAVGERVRVDGARAKVVRVSRRDARKIKVRLSGSRRKQWLLDSQLDPPEGAPLARLWRGDADADLAADRSATALVLRALGVAWTPAARAEAHAPRPPPPPPAPPPTAPPAAAGGADERAASGGGSAPPPAAPDGSAPAAGAEHPWPAAAETSGERLRGAQEGSADGGRVLSGGAGAAAGGADGGSGVGAAPPAAAGGAAGSLRSLFLQPAAFSLFGGVEEDDADDAGGAAAQEPPLPEAMGAGGEKAPGARAAGAAAPGAAASASGAGGEKARARAEAVLQPVLFMRTNSEAELTEAWRERRQQGFKDFKSKHKADVRQALKRSKHKLAMRGGHGKPRPRAA